MIAVFLRNCASCLDTSLQETKSSAVVIATMNSFARHLFKVIYEFSCDLCTLASNIVREI